MSLREGLFERFIPSLMVVIMGSSLTISAIFLLQSIGLYSIPVLVVLLIVGSYLTFTILYENYVILKSRDYKLPRTVKPLEENSVSIIVPTRNEPPELVEDALKSIRALNYRNFEIIVTDESDPAYHLPLIEICRKYGAVLLHSNLNPGFNAIALRRAVKQAKGELIGLLDSDYRVDSEWLNRTTRFFQIDWIDVVQCPQSYRNLDTPIVRIADALRSMQIHKNKARFEDNALTTTGPLSLYRKEVFEEFYTGNYVTEDFASSVRMILKSRRVFYYPAKIGKGVGPVRITDYARQQARWLDNLRVLKDYIGEIVRLKPMIRFIHLAYHSTQTLHHLAMASLALIGAFTLFFSPIAGIAILMMYIAETLYKFGYVKLHSKYLRVRDILTWFVTDYICAPYLLKQLINIFLGRPSLSVRTPKEEALTETPSIPQEV